MIVAPIESLTVAQLKQFRKAAFISEIQGRALSSFEAKSNELHPFVCESFRGIFAIFAEALRAQAELRVNETYLSHCARTLLVDKTRRLLAKVDATIDREAQRLQQNLQLVEAYPFAKWGADLIRHVETKLQKCLHKCDLNLANVPQYARAIEALRERVTDQVSQIEAQMRQACSRLKDAKSEGDRERLRADLRGTIDRLQQENRDKDTRLAGEIERLRAEGLEASRRMQEQMQQQLNAALENQRQVSAEHERELAEARRAATAAATQAAAAAARQGGQDGGGFGISLRCPVG
jgi:chromosome segregation ATPase